ncbi:Stp1/IreP family PP2C-type Ser/Thr phosphatase [Roseiflexus sp.]|uniref:Stp1/IreP family PP2C-type Ser/Thr phosphatase n=1 Tax=Roseiflexus sp. TaxID=2562120 RepID=UPI00398B6B66
MKLRHSARTDVGKTRDHNEDDFGVGEGAGVAQYGELLIVCDGMGGHAAGEVASRLGVETILSTYYSDSSPDRANVLRQAFERANERIHAEGRGAMGTTGVAALFYRGTLHVANVGDSRAYLIRDDDICQISRDHSLVGEQVAAGIITADQAKSSYYRNVITRALGYQPDVQVDLFEIPLRAGDTVVLCSDGLHGLVSDEEISAIARSMPLADAVDRLIDLANERGGTDNITTIIAHVDELDDAPTTDDPSGVSHTTIEFPATAETVEFPATALLAHEAVEPVTARTAPQLAAPPSAPPPVAASLQRDVPAPRRMNWIGATLATLLFTGLVLVTLFVVYPSVLAPGQAFPVPVETPPTTTPPPSPTEPPTQVPAVLPVATETALPAVSPTVTATPSPIATSTPTATPSPIATSTPTAAPAITATPGASPSTPVATATRTPIPLTPLAPSPTP